MITKHQAEDIRNQLLQTLESLPKDKQAVAYQKILSMSDKELEEFMNQNQQMSQCILCSIASGKIPSHKIAETENSIAVLEINPLSKGHTLIIPKEHLSEIPESIKNFASTLKETISKKLNAKSTRTIESKITEHPVIEIIPVYENQEEKRTKQTNEELKKIQEQILTPEKPKQQIEKKEKPKEIIKLKPRIP